MRGNVPVQVADPVCVGDASVHEPVRIRGAVFRDVERRQVVVGLQPQEQLRQSAREHLPAHVGDFPARRHRVERRSGAGEVARVVVDADEVQRLPDRLHVPVRHLRCVLTEEREDVLRIASAQECVHVPADREPVVESRPGKVCRRFRRRVNRCLIERDAERCRAALRAQRLQGDAVTQEQVVRDLHRRFPAPEAGREDAGLVTQDRDDPGFVVRGNRGCAVCRSGGRPRLHTLRTGRRYCDSASRRLPAAPGAGPSDTGVRYGAMPRSSSPSRSRS